MLAGSRRNRKAETDTQNIFGAKGHPNPAAEEDLSDPGYVEQCKKVTMKRKLTEEK